MQISSWCSPVCTVTRGIFVQSMRKIRFRRYQKKYLHLPLHADFSSYHYRSVTAGTMRKFLEAVMLILSRSPSSKIWRGFPIVRKFPRHGYMVLMGTLTFPQNGNDGRSVMRKFPHQRGRWENVLRMAKAVGCDREISPERRKRSVARKFPHLHMVLISPDRQKASRLEEISSHGANR